MGLRVEVTAVVNSSNDRLFGRLWQMELILFGSSMSIPAAGNKAEVGLWKVVIQYISTSVSLPVHSHRTRSHKQVELILAGSSMSIPARKVDIRLPEKREFKLPWRKAGLLRSSR